MSRQAETSKAIRQELKEKFSKDYPNLKFKVTSQSFAGGDSVHIDWFNGPTVEEVREVSEKYQEGHFDGMEDIYEYSNTNNDIPQVKFVQTGRQFNSEATKKGIELIKEKFDVNICIIKEYVSSYYKETMAEVENIYLDEFQCWSSALVYRELRKLQLK